MALTMICTKCSHTPQQHTSAGCLECGCPKSYESVKVSQESVNYRQAENIKAQERCGNCEYFVLSAGRSRSLRTRETTSGLCSLVDGSIHPTWVCDLFEDKSELIHNAAEEAKESTARQRYEPRNYGQ